MDGFAIIMFGGVAIVVIALLLLGKYYPGSGAEVLDWRTPQSIFETQAQLEADDLDQMMELRNQRRRARGEPEVTVEQLELQVAADMRAQQARRDEYMRDADISQMLEATNRRRRKRGQPELTLEGLRADLESRGLSRRPPAG